MPLMAQSLAEPRLVVEVTPVPPMAHAFAAYSAVSTVPVVLVAHSLAAPRAAVLVTLVPPIAHALAAKSVEATMPVVCEAHWDACYIEYSRTK